MSLSTASRPSKTLIRPLLRLRQTHSIPLSTLASTPLLQSRLRSQTLPPCPNHPFKTFSQTRHFCQSPSQLATPNSIQQPTGRDLVLSPPALVITREYEWANLLVGFEQANKYTIRAAPGAQVVGYLAEETSIGRTITRNVLRTHRPFKATVFDKEMNILFTMRRPMYFISTSIFVEASDGEVLGEVHMNWHMWRRRYGLYVDKTQFASVDSGFLAVDFDMRDVDGKKIASVNKDFTGIARELFTDARQYVIRLDPSFGLDHDASLVNDASTLHSAAEELSGTKLGHRERAVILASAIAIDFDYFSLHSGGAHPGLMMMPGGGTGGGTGGGAVPIPVGVGEAGEAASAEAGTAVGADVLSDAASAETGADVGGSQMPNFGEGIDADPYGTPMNDPAGMEGVGQNQEWATFEEPDHGFEDPYADENVMSDDSDWSDGGDEEGGGVVGSIMRTMWGMFSGDD